MSKPKINVVGLAVFLALISAIAAGLLAGVAVMTKGAIKEAQLEEINRGLKEVLPAYDNVPAKDTMDVKSQGKGDIPVTFYAAKKGNKLIAVAGKSYTPRGYGGKVTALVGLNLDGKIRTVIITKQNETPGLGTVVTDRKREKTIFDVLGMGKKEAKNTLPPNKILDQFDGHAADKKDSWKMPWKVKKDGGNVDYITGATISSRAVTDVVYRIASTYEENKSEILKKFGDTGTEK